MKSAEAVAFADQYRSALRLVGSSVAILTAIDEAGAAAAITITTVNALSMDPKPTTT